MRPLSITSTIKLPDGNQSELLGSWYNTVNGDDVTVDLQTTNHVIGEAEVPLVALKMIGSKRAWDHTVDGRKLPQDRSWFTVKPDGKFRDVSPPVSAMINASRAGCWCVSCAFNLRSLLTLVTLVSLISGASCDAADSGFDIHYRGPTAGSLPLTWPEKSVSAEACRIADPGVPHYSNCSSGADIKDAKPTTIACGDDFYIYARRIVEGDKAYCPTDEPIKTSSSRLSTIFRNAMLAILVSYMCVVADVAVGGYKPVHRGVLFVITSILLSALVAVHRAYLMLKLKDSGVFLSSGFSYVVMVVNVVNLFCVDCLTVTLFREDVGAVEFSIYAAALFILIQGVVFLIYRSRIWLTYVYSLIRKGLAAMRRRNYEKRLKLAMEGLAAAGGVIEVEDSSNKTLLVVKGSQVGEVAAVYNLSENSVEFCCKPRGNPNAKVDFVVKADYDTLLKALFRAKPGYKAENATGSPSRMFTNLKVLKPKVIPLVGVDAGKVAGFKDNAALFVIPSTGRAYMHVAHHTFGTGGFKPANFGLVQLAQNGKIITFASLLSNGYLRPVMKMQPYDGVVTDSLLYEIVDKDTFAILFGVNWKEVPILDIASCISPPAAASIWSYRLADATMVNMATSFVGHTSTGHIVTEYHEHDSQPLLQLHDCSTMGGDSGSPITSTDGTVVYGFHLGGDESGVPVNYMVPAYPLAMLHGLIMHTDPPISADDGIVGEVSAKRSYGKGKTLDDYLSSYKNRTSKETKFLRDEVNADTRQPEPTPPPLEQLAELKAKLDAIAENEEMRTEQFQAFEAKIEQLFRGAGQLGSSIKKVRIMEESPCTSDRDLPLIESVKGDQSPSSSAASAPQHGPKLQSVTGSQSRGQLTDKSGQSSTASAQETCDQSVAPPKGSTQPTEPSTSQSSEPSKKRASTSPQGRKSESPSTPTLDVQKSTSAVSTGADPLKQSPPSGESPAVPPATPASLSARQRRKLKLKSSDLTGTTANAVAALQMAATISESDLTSMRPKAMEALKRAARLILDSEKK
jgi:hypothetical protein